MKKFCVLWSILCAAFLVVGCAEPSGEPAGGDEAAPASSEETGGEEGSGE